MVDIYLMIIITLDEREKGHYGNRSASNPNLYSGNS